MICKNIEVVERLIRIMFGFVLFVVSYQMGFLSIVNYILVFFGFVMIFTGFFGWCYAYEIFGAFSNSSKSSLKPISLSEMKKEIKNYKN